MDKLAQALLPVHYETEEWGAFLIEPPTVRQAYLFYHLVPHYETDSFAQRIEEILYDWLGRNPIWNFIQDYLLKTRITIASQIINACEPEIEGEKAGKSEWLKDQDVSHMIAEYRYYYHCDPLQESWPYFLTQAYCLNQLKGEIGLSNLAWYAAGKSEEALNSLMKSAGYYKDGQRAVEEQTEENTVDTAQQVDNASAIAEMAKLYQNTYYA